MQARRRCRPQENPRAPAWSPHTIGVTTHCHGQRHRRRVPKEQVAPPCSTKSRVGPLVDSQPDWRRNSTGIQRSPITSGAEVVSWRLAPKASPNAGPSLAVPQFSCPDRVRTSSHNLHRCCRNHNVFPVQTGSFHIDGTSPCPVAGRAAASRHGTSASSRSRKAASRPSILTLVSLIIHPIDPCPDLATIVRGNRVLAD